MRIAPKLFLTALLACAGAWTVAAPQPVFAPSGAPGFVNIQLPPITPEEAEREARMRVIPKDLNAPPIARVPRIKRARTTAAGDTGSAAVTASILELALALKNDVNLIYEYVRNNIAFVPMYGLQRGGFGALIDQQGTALDQADLLVKLLRQAGYTASYVKGTITISGEQFRNWLGVDIAGKQCQPASVLSAGSVPYSSCVYDANNTITRISIRHVWVRISFNKADGTKETYDLDPSFKPHTVKAPLNLAAITGYTRSDFLSTATTGASSATSTTVENINRQGIRDKLTAYASTLATWLRTNRPDARLEDIVGGQVIVPHSGTVLNTKLPYSAIVVEQVLDGEIPDNYYKYVITVSYAGMAIKRSADDLYGKRLTISFGTDGKPLLKLDGDLLQAGTTALKRGTDGIVTVTVSRPVTIAGATPYSMTIKAGGTYHVNTNVGPVSRGLVEHLRNKLEAARQAETDSASEPVLGSSLALMGATWLAQKSQAEFVTARLGGERVAIHDQMGIAGYFDAPYVDLPGNFSSTSDLDASPANFNAIFASSATRMSMFESTTVQQVTGGKAASTVSLLDLAAQNGGKFHSIAKSDPNYESILLGMASNPTCPADYLAQVRGFLNSAYSNQRVIVPAQCQTSPAGSKWKGMGYFGLYNYGKDNSYSGLTARIYGGYGSQSGGYSLNPLAPTPMSDNSFSNTISPIKLQPSSGKSFGDPIDMLNGSYLYAHEDINTGLGAFPHSLNLQRVYSSGRSTASGPLGLGWTHNLAASASEGTDGMQGLGEDSALDAAAALVEQMVALDLYSDADRPLLNIVAAAIGQAWLGDQLVDNTVIVRQGLNGEVFVKLPDGSYNAPQGSPVKLTRNADGSYVYETLHKSKLNFNTAGRLASYVHPSGVRANFTYTGDNLTQVQNSFGRTLTLAYSGTRLDNVSDGSRTVRYAYDAAGNLKSFTNANTAVTSYAYDLPGRMTQVFYPSKPTVAFVTNVYDSLGRVQTQTNANNQVYQYFFAGTRSEELDPLQGSKVSYYDGRGKVTRSIDELGRVTASDYDGHGRLVLTTLPEGNRIAYEYDDAPCAAQLRCTHNVKTVTQQPKPGSGLPELVNSFTYESSFNFVNSATDARGKVTNYTYTLGMPANVTAPADPAGVRPVTSTTYTSYSGVAGFPAFSLPTSVKVKTSSTNDVVTTTAYNTANKFVPQSTTVDSGADKLNLVTGFVYDAVGNLTQIDGPRNDVSDVTTFGYNGERLRTSITNALGEVTFLGYNADGRLVRTAQSRAPDFPNSWLVSCNNYTNSGKLDTTRGPAVTAAATTCPDPAATTTPLTDYTWDALDRVQRVTQSLTTAQGGNRVTETDYYADGAVKEVRRAVGNTALEQTYASYTYTSNGLVSTQTDARGNVTTYEYDGHDRRTKLRFPDKTTAGVSSDTDFEQYGYDDNGNVVSVRKRSGQSVALAWDNLNRLRSRTYPAAANKVNFTYDLLGRRTAAKKGDGHDIAYEWDNAGRLKSTTAGARTLGYEYDAAGNRTRITWPDASFVTTAYDELNRPTAILEQGTTALASYAYGPRSQRKTVTLGNGTTTSYAYDNRGDLSTLTHDVANAAADVAFSYARNRAREITTTSWNNDAYMWRPAAVDNGTKRYTANALDQYTAVTGASPSWTANGNLAGDGTWSYGYDLDNQLTSASKAGYSATLSYDAEGRMRQTVLGGVTTHLLYDGDDLVAEYDGAGTLLKRYVHGPGTDEPLVVYDGAGTATKSWLYADHLGSVVAQADAAGSTTALYSYGPFGEPNTDAGVRFRYTGQQYLAGLGLYHYKARFYSPALGRFLQTDPIGTADDLNLYGYVGNNPVNLVDPSGLMAAEALMLAGKLGAELDNTVTGGYGAKFTQAAKAGNYGQAALNVGAGVAWGLTNFATDGTVAAAGGAVRAGQGGAFNALKGTVGDDLTAHHIPQAALKFTNRAEGGAVVMTTAEHTATRTFGYKGAVTAVQDAAKSFRDVLAADIRDVRNIVGNAYNSGLRTVTDYYRKNFPQLMTKPPKNP